MIWHPNCIDLFPQINHSLVDLSYDQKKKILIQQKNVCAFCGGSYSKAFNFVKFSKDILEKPIYLCCRFCYIISHLNHNFYNFNEIEIYHSSLPQKIIVQKTVDFFLKFNSIPLPNEIDKNVLKVSLSVLEYIHILHKFQLNISKINNYQVPFFLKNLKIFFTANLDYQFLDQNFGYSQSLFKDTTPINSVKCENSNKTKINLIDEFNHNSSINLYNFDDKQKQIILELLQ